jgi:type II secretory pathway component PulF
MFSIAADERAALQFDDVASALDAGLPITAIGGDASAGDRVLHSALAGRGVRLTPTEDAVLEHAWRAGRAGDALRGRARARVRRAEFQRTVWSGLRYPLLLAIMVPIACAATAAVIGTGLLVAVLAVYAALAVVLLAVRHGARTGAPWLRRVPLAARIVDGLAELPYLETLHALYGAGVPLRDAHRSALATVPAGAVAARLRVADAAVQAGRPLRDGLAEALALHPETRTLLATGEHSGHLEDALQRALVRRQDVTGREVAVLARRTGQIAYAAAVVAVVVVVFRFYSDFYGRLSGLRRH